MFIRCPKFVTSVVQDRNARKHYRNKYGFRASWPGPYRNFKIGVVCIGGLVVTSAVATLFIGATTYAPSEQNIYSSNVLYARANQLQLVEQGFLGKAILKTQAIIDKIMIRPQEGQQHRQNQKSPQP